MPSEEGAVVHRAARHPPPTLHCWRFIQTSLSWDGPQSSQVLGRRLQWVQPTGTLKHGTMSCHVTYHRWGN